jgi:hypothetical protein
VIFSKAFFLSFDITMENIMIAAEQWEAIFSSLERYRSERKGKS